MNARPLLSLPAVSLPLLCVSFAGLTACVAPADTFVSSRFEACPAEARDSPLRVATYNIKAARDSSLDEIAQVIADLDADVVSLQEVDRLMARSGHVDQARELAERLDMHYAFAAARVHGDGEYGVALLSRSPFTFAERVPLPSLGSFEPRVAVGADVCVGGETVRVFSTHIDLNPVAAKAQHRALSDIAAPFVGEGVIVTGDLNATARDVGLRALFSTPLTDLGAADDEPTCDGRRIDFLLADAHIADATIGATVIATDASDHYPVVVEMAL